ncbi:MAG TPA: DNA methyltransferase [Bryobacteraceae bacterium]|jgi:adenine specific DNA methylase Mod
MNRLYYGDNLTVLRGCIDAESVDLIYLDPPFNSQATYNVLFKSTAGEKSRAQIGAFEDTWHWGEEAELAFDGVISSGNSDAAEMLRALRSFLREADMMAYLSMMAVRLLELRRVLRPTGSLYLRCDPTASHYLKLLMDAIFGISNFQNEISWKRTTTKNDYRQGAINWPRIRDVILYYSKDRNTPPAFNQLFSIYSKEYVASHYSQKDESGRSYQLDNLTAPGAGSRGHPVFEFTGVTRYWRYNKRKMEELLKEGRIIQPHPDAVPRYKRFLDEMPGIAIGDTWDDISAINSQAQERLGYPTQKPQALLERIVAASSDGGDVVLDPFCGCGTAIHAAHKLHRQWIGIDITHLAISLIEKRLKDAFPGIRYEVHGTPKDVDGARDLAARDKYQFQWWAVSLVNAVPFAGRKKGADSGIDGLIYFKPEGKVTEKAIVSVKGGENVNVVMVRDLAHVVDRENARIGVFITLADSTGPMRTEAVKAGYYQTLYGKYLKIQILTIRELFEGKQPNIPLVDASAFKRAPKESQGDQGHLPL